MQKIYDVIVIGLGAMGSAALYQLAKRGATVLGIDQYRPPHAFGSTHGETRITRLAIGEGPAYVPFAKRSHAIWRELEAETGESLLHLCGGLILCPEGGGAQFHGQTDFVTHTASIAHAHEIEHAVLDAATVRQRWPQLRITDREHAYFEPTGGVVAVDKAVATQLRLAAQHGATLQLEERVIDYTYTTDGVTVTTDRGTYHAAKVIVSAGAWVADFVPQVTATAFGVYRQVIHWFAADNPSDFSTERLPFLLWIGDSQAEFFSAFPYFAGGTPGLKVVTEEYLATTTPQSVDRVVHPAETARMYNEFVTRRMNGARPDLIRSAVCLYTNTPDEHFVIDFHPESDRVIVASPCSGHGFKHSAAIGETLAQLTLDGSSELAIDVFAFDRLASRPFK